MTGRRELVVAAAACAGLAAGLVVAVCSPQRAGAERQGVAWADLSVDDALAQARREDKKVLVEFFATWCPECKRLDAEVLSTADGAALAAGVKVIPVRVDFDAEASRPLVERFVVLGLPTVLVLSPGGEQLGRLTGYEGREAFLAQAKQALESDDPVPALRALATSQPGSAGAALRLGEALLVRGEADEGEALLERAMWLSGGGGESAGAGAGAGAETAEALFLLGRYYHRVKRDPATARHLWRELATRFPSSEWAEGALWWYAKAEAELGRPAVGLEALRARAAAAPDELDPLLEWGQFAVKNELLEDRARLQKALGERRATSKLTDEQRQEIDELAKALADPR
jgi:thiol-disulfide isomerase/thioredoxin